MTRSNGDSRKLKLLALHGHNSNSTITCLQLQNLGFDTYFDITCLDAPFVVENYRNDSNPTAATENDSHTPTFTWIAGPSSFKDTHPVDIESLFYCSDENETKCIVTEELHQTNYNTLHKYDEIRASIKHSLYFVLQHIQRHGPYDAVYGFSQGGAIATILSHPTIREMIWMEMKRCRLDDSFGVEESIQTDTYCDFCSWKVIFLACAANLTVWNAWAEHAGLTSITEDFTFNRNEDSTPLFSIPSVHFIGMYDVEFKLQAEAMTKLFASESSCILYLPSGHEIPSSKESKRLGYDALFWCYDISSDHGMNIPLILEDKQQIAGSHFTAIYKELNQLNDKVLQKSTSKISPIHVCAHGQVVFNSSIQSSSSSLWDVIWKYAQSDTNRILLYSSESPYYTLTYLQLCAFIISTTNIFSILKKPTLRTRERILYLAPQGVYSAVTFLTVAAHHTAIPIDPSCTVREFQRMIDLCHPSICIIFENIYPDQDKIQSIAFNEGVQVWMAQVIPTTCGLFTISPYTNSEHTIKDFDYEQYIDDIDKRVTEWEPPAMIQEQSICKPFSSIHDHPMDVSIILLTSGTTSLPKVVPIQMNSIMSNAFNIAHSLGICSFDVALNAMPLFHIGGLASNLLASLVMGASVIIMPRFDSDAFLKIIYGQRSRRRDVMTEDFQQELPRPTWYSAVPTMHAVIVTLAKAEDDPLDHSLRFIRTGASHMDINLAMDLENTFHCPVVMTYSMTEQMPISQPLNILLRKIDSVGQPLVTGLAIIDETLQPLPFAEANKEIGEICIHGELVLKRYDNNKDANVSSYFLMGGRRWFRTGDLGYVDSDGFLFLKGRMKELIKRGGQQINPLEVEYVIRSLDCVKTVVVFPIPDNLWGECVGAAVVLQDNCMMSIDELKCRIKTTLMDSLQQFCIPDFITIIEMSEIPNTSTGKFRRSELATLLYQPSLHIDCDEVKYIDIPPSIQGLRFLLALAVCYVHIGSFGQFSRSFNKSQALFTWTHSRSWCFHTPLFFFLGGFLMSQRTRAEITLRQYVSFIRINILSLHPIYLISILWCTLHFVAMCRSSNFVRPFVRDAQPSPGKYMVCQGTPAEQSWGTTLFLSLIIYSLGLQAWPISIYVSWFLSSYTWFSSVYYFCILMFPFCHKPMFRYRSDTCLLWRMTFIWVMALYTYMTACAFIIFVIKDNDIKNFVGLGSYLLPVGWIPCFGLGITVHLLYQHYGATMSHRTIRCLGLITDAISLIFLTCWLLYGLFSKTVPTLFKADGLSLRLWDAFLSRILHPVGIVWFCGLLSNYGLTAKLLSFRVFSIYLSQISYNMFLFHQPVSELYFLVTRNIWWRYPKVFYWFSPFPVPVLDWEFPIVAFFVILVSAVMQFYINEFILNVGFLVKRKVFGTPKKDFVNGTESRTIDVIIRVATMLSINNTRIQGNMTLSSVGITSLMSVIFVNRVNAEVNMLKTRRHRTLYPHQLVNFVCLQDIADYLDDDHEPTL